MTRRDFAIATAEIKIIKSPSTKMFKPMLKTHFHFFADTQPNPKNNEIEISPTICQNPEDRTMKQLRTPRQQNIE